MIIVTGGAGFIGSNIVKFLNRKNISNILVVDNLKDGTKFINLVDLNISDYMDKSDFLLQIKVGKEFGNIEAIFHEGACCSTINWNGKYIIDNNYQYSKQVLHYCLDRKIPFLYASSAAIYGICTKDFIESRKHEHPLNVYAYSKLLFDEYVRKLLPNVKSQIVGFRYFNVYGPREGHKGKMASVPFQLNSQLNKGEKPKLFVGSNNFKRDFVYVDDVAAVNFWFLQHGISGIFNIGTGKAESFQSVANIILTYHKEISMEYIPFPDKLKGRYQTYTQANLTKLRTVGYENPFKNLAEGLSEYLVLLKNDM